MITLIIPGVFKERFVVPEGETDGNVNGHNHIFYPRAYLPGVFQDPDEVGYLLESITLPMAMPIGNELAEISQFRSGKRDHEGTCVDQKPELNALEGTTCLKKLVESETALSP